MKRTIRKVARDASVSGTPARDTSVSETPARDTSAADTSAINAGADGAPADGVAAARRKAKEPAPLATRRAGVVLGGGGAGGFAHIGVLRAIEERGIEISCMTGCSMGGIVAAIYLAGHSPDDIAALAQGLRARTLLRPGRHGALLGGAGVEQLLRKLLPETFEELRRPLKVTAVDLQTGRLVILGSGLLVPALRSTTAIPGILEPVFIGDRVMGDGALLNNIPVDVIRTMTLDPVIAVDVAPPPNRPLRFKERLGLREKLRHLLAFRRQQWLTLQLLLKDYEITQHRITALRLTLDPPDLLIRPALPHDLTIERFDRSADAIRIGYEEAARVLDGCSLFEGR